MYSALSKAQQHMEGTRRKGTDDVRAQDAPQRSFVPPPAFAPVSQQSCPKHAAVVGAGRGTGLGSGCLDLAAGSTAYRGRDVPHLPRASSSPPVEQGF